MTPANVNPAPATGLSNDEVTRRRASAGWNELPQPKATSPVVVFLRQFKSALVLLLLAAAPVAWFIGERIDTVAILVVVALNAVLGFVQEWRAETALSALRNMLTQYAIVRRDGQEQRIEAREIVPGDLVILEAGDRVPADGTLLLSMEMQVDESVLTGESEPVAKTAGGKGAAGRALTGTTVVGGRAEMQVDHIGAATEFGRIAALTAAPGPKTTNLQRKLSRLASRLGLVAVGVALLILATGLAMGRDTVEMMMTGLSLAVALVPEGLPAVVTITLALGVGAMARQKALARRLQAVETLGAASVICTDKTGTLTENKMTATRIWMPDQGYEVTGTGYDPAGHIEADGRRVRAADDAALALLLDCAVTCNHAHLRREGENWVLVGEPTEGALVTLAYKGWATTEADRNLHFENPFSSDRKRMSVLAQRDGECHLFAKGAPEQLMEVCTHMLRDGRPHPLDQAGRAEVSAAYEAMAGEGLRVIALADRVTGPDDAEESDLTFLGLVGMIDPPRPEVRDAMTAARKAGVRVIVITGDSMITARAVAAQVGLSPHRFLSGTDVDDASDEDLVAAVQGNVLFARTRPAHKMRIVQALQRRGKIVAMTGDGVNDAPALKQADIGVSMGIRGTDVARDASDLVLMDDNFATIVRAIAEGRRQFDNLKKFIRYLLCSNAGEVLAIMVNIMIGGPLIFLATQILWMNLITDSLTAVALGLERPEKGQMREAPRAPDAPIIGKRGLGLILLFGLYTGSASLWVFYQMLPMGVDVARTTAFTAMIFFEKFSVFAFRSLRQPCWRIGLASNPFLLGALALSLGAQVLAVYWPPLQTLLRTVPLAADAWLVVGLLTLPLIIVPELVKTIRVRMQRAPEPAI